MLPHTLKWGAYLYQALHSPLGIYLKSPDTQRLKGVLYNARNKLNDPALTQLTIRTSPLNPTGELWLIKNPERRVD